MNTSFFRSLIGTLALFAVGYILAITFIMLSIPIKGFVVYFFYLLLFPVLGFAIAVIVNARRFKRRDPLWKNKEDEKQAAGALFLVIILVPLVVLIRMYFHSNFYALFSVLLWIDSILHAQDLMFVRTFNYVLSSLFWAFCIDVFVFCYFFAKRLLNQKILHEHASEHSS